MTLIQEWKKLIDNQTEDSFPKFWEEYSDAEKKIYADILARGDGSLSGRVSELAEKFGVRPIMFMGFLDGVQTSLKGEQTDLEKVGEDSEISLDIDYKKLLFNMFKADAQHLYGLEEWKNVYGEEEFKAIHDEYRRSRTVRVEKKPGRNDPCPCGSGKKYKNCCGRAS